MNTRLVCTAIVTAVVLFCLPATVPQRALAGGLVQGPITPATQIATLKVTLLSTMLVGSPAGLGEWGFSALVEADGHRILLDTGAHPDTVLQNARDLNVDLSDVQEVVLTHNHWDHVTGLLTLRREIVKKNPTAMSVVHVAKGIFFSRPSTDGEDNPMIAIRKEFEDLGGRFIEHSDGADIFPGAWLTGP